MREAESLEWAGRSTDFAFDCGATAATLIPTRADAVPETLSATGDFAAPSLTTLEAATISASPRLRPGFADLWDINSPQPARPASGPASSASEP